MPLMLMTHCLYTIPRGLLLLLESAIKPSWLRLREAGGGGGIKTYAPSALSGFCWCGHYIVSCSLLS